MCSEFCLLSHSLVIHLVEVIQNVEITEPEVVATAAFAESNPFHRAFFVSSHTVLRSLANFYFLTRRSISDAYRDRQRREKHPDSISGEQVGPECNTGCHCWIPTPPGYRCAHKKRGYFLSTSVYVVEWLIGYCYQLTSLNYNMPLIENFNINLPYMFYSE